MLDENYGFCPHCGENLKSDAVYCPACGTVLKSEAFQQQQQQYKAYAGKSPMSGAFMVAFIMLVVYAILELIGSAMLLTFNESTYDALNSLFVEAYGKTFPEYMYDMVGMTITKEELLSEFFIMGITGVASAILAGVSAFFCYKRENFKFAIGACVLSAVVVFIGSALCPMTGGVANGFFSMLIGLLVAYLIYSSRARFAQ